MALALILAWAAVPAAAANGGGGTPAGGGAPAATSAPAARRSSAHVLSVRITAVSCTPTPHCSGNPSQVSVHGTLLVKGTGLKPGMAVGFPKAPGARVTPSSPTARLYNSSLGLLATVPKAAHSGHVMVLLSHGRYTSSFGPIYIFAHALHPVVKKVTIIAPPAAAASTSALDGQGMWIWYVSKSDGGQVAAIIAQAHAAGVSTVFVKSSDGSSNYWGQFSAQLVQQLHAAGLKVCAWQYVYGSNPAGEANLGAEAATNGADCLVIDAEAEYEGRYAAAQTYIATLRARLGATYPLALASFPYVSYHPTFPYSVFLGPGGAQYNAPQMYWKDIGVSVDTVYANTYIANRIYQRPISPLGQTYGNATPTELLRFREEAVDYGATGWSFWDWQETSGAGWNALSAPMTPLTTVTPNTTYPELSRGSRGDQVLWLQEHLATAEPSQETTGTFGPQTLSNLEAFQGSRGLPVSGVSDAATWAALLALTPVPVSWTGRGPPA